jgi:hypothetical protein
MLDDGLPPNAATYYRIPDILGYDAIDRWRLRRLLEIAGPFGRMSAVPHADSWVHDLLGIRVVTRRDSSTTNPDALPLVFAPDRVVLVDGPEAARLALRAAGFDPSRTAVVESPASSNRAVLASPARVSRPGAARLQVALQVTSPGLVIVSESYDPGWSAWVDGAPADIRPAYLALMAVDVPPGHRTLELRFRPRTWPVAVALSTAGLLVVVLMGRADARDTARRAVGRSWGTAHRSREEPRQLHMPVRRQVSIERKEIGGLKGR